MKRRAIPLIVLLMSVALLNAQCKKDKEEEDKADDFDRAALLVNYADNLILPAYLDLKVASDDLLNSIQAFESQTDQNNLIACRAAWQNTVIKWQYAAPYSFGPARNVLLQDNSNIYPTSSSEINANISMGSYNLESAANVDTKGLPAMDYLLHGTGVTETDVVNWFSDATDGAARLTYLKDLAIFFQMKAEMVHNEWKADGGNYRGTFLGSTGTEVGSSLGLLLNAFIQSYERNTRADKLGTPAGALTFSQTPLPDHVEAYYEADNNLAYLTASMQAFDHIYHGTDQNGNNGSGFDDYLTHVGATYSGGSLNDAIGNQITASLNGIQTLSDPLSHQVVNNQQATLDVYAELQQLVVLWKVDMMSNLGVLITYQDNDGD